MGFPPQGTYKAINRVLGITPTFTIFDTNPSNPERITDGDFITETGEGVKALGAPGIIGTMNFDMGSAHPVLIVAHMNVHRDSGDGTISVYVDYSPDGVLYYTCGAFSISGVTTDTYYPFDPIFMYARYFRVRVYASGTSVPSVYHVKIAQIQAIQLI